MRLNKTRAAAEEDITGLVNQGYALLDQLSIGFEGVRGANEPQAFRELAGSFDEPVGAWEEDVRSALRDIFPSEAEVNRFRYAHRAGMRKNRAWIQEMVKDQEDRLRDRIAALERIVSEDLPRYTDLPEEPRIFVEGIDSFRRVRDVNPAMVSDYLDGGYLDLSEDAVQMALEQILDVPFHRKDWGGETCDLYTANVVINGRRRSTAFLLKGNGLRKKTMEIADCGKNGDQLLRLFDAGAELVVVQFIGMVSEAVVRDVAGKVDERRAKGKSTWFCIIDGQDTARLLRAHGKL
jgi:hypothetical protein